MSLTGYTRRGGKASEPDYTLQLTCNDLGINMVAYLPQEFMFDVRSNYEAPFSNSIQQRVGSAADILKAVGINLTSQALTAQVWQGSDDIQFTLPIVLQAIEDEQADVIAPMFQLMSLVLPKEETAGGLLRPPGPHIDPDRLMYNLQEGAKATLNATKSAYQEFTAATKDGIGKALSEKASSLSGQLLSSITGNDGVEVTSNLASTTLRAGRRLADQVSSTVSQAIKASIRNQISLTIGRYLYFPSVVIVDVQTTHTVQPVRSGNYQRVELNVTFKTFMTPTQNDLKEMFRSGERGMQIARDSRKAHLNQR